MQARRTAPPRTALTTKAVKPARVDRHVLMTDSWVKAVKPEPAPVDWRDTKQGGLVLRVEVSGRKTWVARYWFNGRDRRFKLGVYDATSLSAARTAAKGTLGKAATGTDPQVEKERRRLGQDVKAAVAAWLADTKLGPAAKWKGGLKGGSARSFLPHVRRFERELGSTRLSELTPKDVERFVSHPEAAATRNRALTALRGFFWWAGRKGLVDSDPTAALTKERETERARVLSDGELRALVHGFNGGRYGRAVRFLALTGVRRDEALGAKWPWFDMEAGVLTIPPEAEKTGRSRGELRRVPLSTAALALLAEQRKAQFAEGIRSEHVFATTTGERPHPDALKPVLNRLRGLRSNGQPASKDKRAKARVAALSPDVTIHDVRRTIANALLNQLSARTEDVNHVVLGHVRPKLIRTYMPVLPIEDARTALEQWAAELARILGEAPVTQRDAQ